jgi:TPR repeat protein
VPKPVPAPEKPAEEEAPAPAPATAAATPEVPPPPKPVKKPAAKPPAAKAEDSVALGEKYLYGRGVPQSCEKGLHYVKPAADQSNPKAMITMGALYATGHCLSRDLPTAYRYFALALRQDPANSALKQNTEMVWGQMTQSERQLAIRLTQ